MGVGLTAFLFSSLPLFPPLPSPPLPLSGDQRAIPLKTFKSVNARRQVSAYFVLIKKLFGQPICLAKQLLFFMKMDHSMTMPDTCMDIFVVPLANSATGIK
jgi:hypothetical protein